VIRPARAAEAAAIAAVHARAREAWSAFLDVARLPAGAALWAARLAVADAATFVWDDGAVRGFVALTHAGDDDLAGRPVGEVLALYVDPPAQRRGIASALEQFAAAERRAAGDHELVLWVYAGNAAGRAFYAARGWAAEPASQQYDPVGDVDEVRYRRPL
jgi:GNAT superfamily N-acetyltransferase